MRFTLHHFSLLLFLAFAAFALIAASLIDSPWLLGAMLLLGALAAHALMAWQFIAPLQRLVVKLRRSIACTEVGGPKSRLENGLQHLELFFEQLQSMATHDRLTGLNNRLIFDDRMARSLLDSQRSGRRYVLILLNIDQLKSINQAKGRFIGDSILKQLAHRMQNNLRQSDTVARFERDNFAILMEDQANDQLGFVVNKIHDALTAPYHTLGGSISIGVRMGAAIAPQHGVDTESLYRSADQALTQAMQSDESIVFYQADANAPDNGMSQMQSLKRALEEQAFKLVLQPVLDMKTHDTDYLEALLRWDDPRVQDQPINKTIAFAEKNQLIGPLTDWVIERACQVISEHGIDRMKIGINLSMIDLNQADLPARLQAFLQQYGIGGQQLMIEITEGVIMENPDHVLPILEDIVALGIALSIDDFGTGQASLTYLKKLPVEKIKIDQSFIKEIASNPDDRVIVDSTIKLAHSLGIKVVAEGVEDAEIFEILADLDCDFAQGYYLSLPLENDQLDSWYAENTITQLGEAAN